MNSDEIVSQSLARVRAHLIELDETPRKLDALRQRCAELEAQLQTKLQLIRSGKKRIDRLRRKIPELENDVAVRQREAVAQKEAVRRYSEWLATAQEYLETAARRVPDSERALKQWTREVAKIERSRRPLDALPVVGRSYRGQLKDARAKWLTAKRDLEAAGASRTLASKALKAITKHVKRGQSLLDVKLAAEENAKSLIEQVPRIEKEIEKSIADANLSVKTLKSLLTQARTELDKIAQRHAQLLTMHAESRDVRARQLSWEVLPSGWWRDAAYITRLEIEAAVEGVRLDISRLVKLASLSPRASYRGWYLDSSTGTRRYPYHVFEFDSVAIADCQQFGNALYYAPVESWRDIFVMTKRGALEAGARRLIHRGDWFGRVRRLVKSKRSKKE